MTSFFPTQDLLPKSETKADSFLANHPEYDGTGITVGILDTGVDPGAFGLSSCPDHSQKVIHIADCTGSGDVAMNTCAEAVLDEHRNGSWVITNGLLGYDLVLNPKLKLSPFPRNNPNDTTTNTTNMNNHCQETTKPSMPVRLGLKRSYELFPKKLVTRVKEHTQSEWEKEHHELAVPLLKELAQWKETFRVTKPTQEDMRYKEEILARLELIQGKGLCDGDLLKEEPGQLYQVVLYYDGTDYRVIIDTHGNGDLTHIDKGMTDFHKEYEYKRFSNVDMLNYCVNIYQSGQVVSIVCDAGAHGTHVAGITARHHGGKNSHNNNDDDDVNGVAPGAKIVALKIGDSRLGSMETGSALTRAMIEAVKFKCDVINLSYGEGCALPNTGRFVELAEELVYKHKIVFVSSAGNNGPALSTVGAPGGTSDAILGVAAYVSPKMMKSEYSMNPIVDKGSGIEENNGTTYTWSSVGPTVDGAFGVDLTAPGAAITSVPNWSLQKSQLMNGTSMSSPNAAGCIALLLSAAKAEGLSVSPVRLKRSIVNSATPIPGLIPLQQGAGIINVEAAWEYIKNNIDDPYEDVQFKINILNRSGHRGIYLRQPKETSVRHTFSVEINPVFSTSDDVDLETQMKRVAFDMKFQLKSTEEWIKSPDYFFLAHNGRSFKFDVDPTKLAEGVHTGKLEGYDCSRSNMGPRFFIPITVAKPMNEKVHVSLGKIEFEPNEVKRYFLHVSMDSTWMDVVVRDLRKTDSDKDCSTRMVVLHTVQLLPHEAYRNAEEKKYLNFLPGEESVTSIAVHGGITCELDIARFWSTQGTTKLEVDVRFRGVITIPHDPTILTGGGGVKVRVASNVSDETILPSAKLTHWKTSVSPKYIGSIHPCDERDVLHTNKKQIHQLILSYEFDMKEAGKFTPRSPAFQGFLYESAFESQLMLIFDEDKRYIGVADSWPSECQAPKGKITIRMQIRHNDVSKLQEFQYSPIWIERKLSKAISLDVYGSHAAMVSKGEKWKKTLLREGNSTAVFFREPAPSDIPSECICGDILFGTFDIVDSPTNLPGAGKKPGGNPISFVVGPKSVESKDEVKVPELLDTRTKDEKLMELLRDAKVDYLKKMMSEKDVDLESAMKLYDNFVIEYPDHVPFHLSVLQGLDDQKDKRLMNLDKIIQVADTIINAVDSVQLACFFGMNIDEEDAQVCDDKKKNERLKDSLIDALARKARALANKNDEQASAEFSKTMKELQKWVDINKNKKFTILTIEKEKRDQRYASAVKILSSLLDNRGKDTSDGICPMTKDDIVKERIQLLTTLGYTSLAKRDKDWSIICSQKEFALF